MHITKHFLILMMTFINLRCKTKQKTVIYQTGLSNFDSLLPLTQTCLTHRGSTMTQNKDSERQKDTIIHKIYFFFFFLPGEGHHATSGLNSFWQSHH